MAPGRLILGVGIGDRAVRRAGLRPATVQGFERGIEEIKRFRDQEPRTDGLPSPDWPVPEFPVHAVATGKRAIEVGFRAADGLIVNTGAAPSMMASFAGRARELRGETFRVRSFNFVSICPDRREALDRLKPSVAWFAMNRPAIVDELDLPRDEKVLARLSELRAKKFDLVHAGDWSQAMDVASFVPDSWVDALGIAGAPRDVLSRVEELTDLGIEEIIIRPPCPALWRESVDGVREALSLSA
jgi:5,10-methylenetetrahydromethanopterin reductase